MGVLDIAEERPAKAFMLCDEAIVRGAIEADVDLKAFKSGQATAHSDLCNVVKCR